MNFFTDIETLYNLIKRDSEGEGTDRKFTLDLIDQAMRFSFNDGSKNAFRMFSRGEFGPKDYSPVTITADENTDNFKVEADFDFDPGMEEFLTGAYRGMAALGRLIKENGIDEKYRDIDDISEGILIYIEDDCIREEFVKGKERPDLMCTSKVNGVGMGRPYKDEIEALFAEMSVPFEEKLKKAEEGDSEMMIQVANGFMRGRDENALEEDNIEADTDKAVYWTKKAAEAGHPMGMYNMGIYSFFGFGMDMDFEESKKWMKKAVENGDTAAKNLIALCDDFIRMKEKAETGDGAAQAEFAYSLMMVNDEMSDFSTEEGYNEAFRWAEKAEKQDYPGADFILGLAYENGKGVEADIERAVKYYEKGAELGDSPCRHTLALMYILGDKIPEDHEKGFELCRQAAEDGYGVAMRTLGKCYEYECGVEQDMDKAFEWYRKALEVINDKELAQRVMDYELEKKSEK